MAITRANSTANCFGILRLNTGRKHLVVSLVCVRYLCNVGLLIMKCVYLIEGLLLLDSVIERYASSAASLESSVNPRSVVPSSHIRGILTLWLDFPI